MTGVDDALTVRVDDLSGSEIARLLAIHLNAAIELSPEGAVHALEIGDLKQPDMTLWSAWIGDELAGCGALRELSRTHGELKSMRTAASYVRKGVAAALLRHMMDVARERGYERLSLETGKTDDFTAARAFYTRFGFQPCPPFGDYLDDGFSLCMTRLV
jgi:putative acetyltransferase